MGMLEYDRSQEDKLLKALILGETSPLTSSRIFRHSLHKHDFFCDFCSFITVNTVGLIGKIWSFQIKFGQLYEVCLLPIRIDSIFL